MNTMKKILLMTLLSNALSAYSATEHTLWMKSADVLPRYQISFSKQGLVQFDMKSHPGYGLTIVQGQNNNSNHTRYTPTYHNLPIWGRQLIVHKQKNKTFKLSGTLISDIEKDIPDTTPKLTSREAASTIMSQVTSTIKAKQIQLIIYIDDNKIAHTAYLLSYYTTSETKGPTNPHYIIDVNDSSILKQWNGVRSITEGEGPGGNTVQLPFRGGAFQYGNSLPNLPSLEPFPMDHWALWCYMLTPNYSVISLENQWVSSSNLDYVFPIYDYEENQYGLSSVSGFCMPWTGLYSNQDDDGYSPVNGAYSPNNDAMYFVNATFEMYKSYGIQYPLGQTDLPLRVFTHISGFDNAFALPTIYYKGTQKIKAHQQIVLSNGLKYFTALTQSVIAHELSHNFTEYNSGLNYSEQAGGINEAFSDMAAIAVMDSIRTKHPFYWDGLDWTLGREATLDGTPLRYIDHPSQDGSSIENANDYTDSLDVHYSSGVFNRAFYLLSNQPGWSIHDAFQVMVDANKNYWEPSTTFNNAACGVIQASIDLQRDPAPVQDAFQQVGVTCTASA